MNFIYIKCHKALGKVKEGETIRVHGTEDGTPLDSAFYDFGWVPFIWAVEHHNGITYASCITTGLYTMQLDIDLPYRV